jgi:hypothetical protein
MHPIERLRFVARSSGASQAAVVRETAGALAAFQDDPAGMVTACRRIVGRHPGVGALWWLCARVLTAVDPITEAWAVADEVDEDGTAWALAGALPEAATVCVLGWPEVIAEAIVRRGDLEVLVVDVAGEGSGLVRRLIRAEIETVDVPLGGLGAAAAASDLILLEAEVCGPERALAVSGSLAAAAVGAHASVPRWLVAGAGRLLPRRYVGSITDRIAPLDDPWDAELEWLPLTLVDRLVGPAGPELVSEGLRRTACPVAPELLVAL